MSESFLISSESGKYRYNSKEDYEKDLSDGVIDGKVNGEAIRGFLANAWDGVCEVFGKYEEVNLSQEEIDFLTSLEGNKNQLNILEGEYDTQVQEAEIFGAKGKHAGNKTEEITESNKDIESEINKKQEEIKQLEAEIARLKAEAEAEQAKKMEEAKAKAEAEYDSNKHGPDKEAFIAQQTAGIKEEFVVPADIEAKITTLKTEIASLESEMESNETEMQLQSKVEGIYNNEASNKQITTSGIAEDMAVVQADVSAGEAVETTIDDTINGKKKK